MSNKITPSPWKIVPRLHAEMHCAVMGADGQLVVNLGDGGNGIETQNANARLIAAAPDLYEALNALAAVMVKEFGEEIKYRPVAVGQYLDRAFQALTKAERKATAQS